MSNALSTRDLDSFREKLGPAARSDGRAGYLSAQEAAELRGLSDSAAQFVQDAISGAGGEIHVDDLISQAADAADSDVGAGDLVSWAIGGSGSGSYGDGSVGGSGSYGSSEGPSVGGSAS
jgi:hypothetical protein